jgi:signal transduction histidine kinase
MVASRVLEKEKENLSERGKEHFERMQNSAERMQLLIEDLLAYSRTATAPRNFENVDLNEIIEQLKQDLQEEIKEKNAIIETTAVCGLNVIRFQFYQLMYNLISNALKFSDGEKAPHITIKSELLSEADSPFEGSASCHMTITDNGIGFDQQYSEKIFELFHRLHRKEEYSGTGLGLAIVKKIVENHDGIITASSEPDKGSTFDIFIPQ